MERLHFAENHSLKNITTPANFEYMKQLVFSIEKYLRRARWRAFYYLKFVERNSSENGEEILEDLPEDSRFKSLFKCSEKPPKIEAMEDFEADLLELPKILQFRAYTNPLQRELKEHLSKIRSDYPNKVIVAGDKTSNYYPCDIGTYRKVLTECVTKDYKRANDSEFTCEQTDS